jgi:hypothetical protein
MIWLPTRDANPKTRSVFERYNAVNEADLAEAARKIEQGASEIPLENSYSLATIIGGKEKQEVPTC